MTQDLPVSPQALLDDYRRLLRLPVAAPDIGAFPVSTALPPRKEGRPCALLFSPHPDDECLTGVLPLRLLREENWQVVNIAVTLGSNLERRAERNAELAKACAVLGFGCALPIEAGFSEVNAATRSDNAVAWRKMVLRLAEILAQIKPEAVFMPHAGDWNPTHIGTHLLVHDALSEMPYAFSCAVVQTEYWQPIAEPNVMVGVGDAEAATLMAAVACHAGEVARNPYDRRFPAYLIDAVRRGSEKLGGKGSKAVTTDFAALYKRGLWLNNKFVPSALKRFVATDQSVGALFE